MGGRGWKAFKSWAVSFLLYILHPSFTWREFCTRTPTFEEWPNRKGQVAVLTGGTRGIGLHVLKGLLRAHFHVIIGCRSLVNGEAVISALREQGITTGSVKVYELDLIKLQSVRKFADNVKKETGKIDLLINNAGICQPQPPSQFTEDGYESQFQVNYLSHFLLTLLLLPLIKETSKKAGKNEYCRIVNVSSDSHFVGWLDFEDLQRPKLYSPNSYKPYCDSKLCQVMHSKYLDSVLKSERVKVNTYSLHPGLIPSDMWGIFHPCVLKLVDKLKSLFRNLEEGADNILYTALSPNLEGVGGVYINTGIIIEPNSQTKDESIVQRLWDRSMELIGTDLNLYKPQLDLKG